MNRIKTNNPGFTIVELLVVIVVIGILAAITIVAYNGIQDRANNVTVRSDLSNVGKLVQLYKISNDGELPVEIYDMAGEYRMKFSGDSYTNGAYCRSTAKLIVSGTSTSGQGYAYDSSTGTVSEVSGNAGACSTFGINSGAVDTLYIASTKNGSTGVWSSYVDH